MGRTIPSFRIAPAMEKEDWKPFHNALDKKDRKKFDDIFDLPKFYISACSNSVQHVRLHPILMFILSYHYKELTECIKEVERIEAKVNSKKKEELMIKEGGEQEKEEEEIPRHSTVCHYYYAAVTAVAAVIAIKNNKVAFILFVI